MNEWVKMRRLLWDDNEQILIADSVKLTGPMKEAGKVTVQPKVQYCCGNSFRPNSTRRKDNVLRHHTWVIEFDDMPLDEQRRFWKNSDMPHTLRVFSGNKSLHVYIRSEEAVSFAEWKQVASDLKLIFPQADAKVLTDCARLSRLPGGVRDDETIQNVETTKARIPLKTLTDWIGGQDVIKNKGIKIYRHKDIEKNLPLSPSSSLDVGSAVRAMRLAEEEYARNHPDRYRLYGTIVEARFKAAQGSRNARLMGMVTFLHDAVSKAVGMEFASLFYRVNALVFHDPLEQHMHEAVSHWDVLDSEYTRRLSVREKGIYQEISEREQVFFRICRSFAFSNESPAGEMTFRLPQTHFGHRMGLDGKQSARLAARLEVYGLLELVKKGTQTKQLKDLTVVTGEAGIYRWIG